VKKENNITIRIIEIHDIYANYNNSIDTVHFIYMLS